MMANTTKKTTSKKRAVKKKSSAVATEKKHSTRKKSGAKKTRSPKKVTNKGNALVFNQVMAINDAKTLRVELSNAIETGNEITIDASSVEMVDTAILQLLLAFIKKVKNNNISFNWSKPSSEFVARADLLNISEELGLIGAEASLK